MAAKKKGPGKGRGPANRPASPAARTTVPKTRPATPPKPPAASAKPTPAKPPAAAPGEPAAPPTKASTKAAPPTRAAPPTKASTKAPGLAEASTKAAGPAKAPGASAKASAAPTKATSAKASAAPARPTATKAKASAAPARSTAIKAKAAAPAKERPRTGPTREERLAAAEAARRKRRLRNKAMLAAGVAAAIFVVGFVVNSDRKARDKQAAQFETGSCRFDRTSDGDDGPGRNHVPNPVYKVDPPAGGNHTPQAAPAGDYTAATAPPIGQIVHAMEHGYVVLWYRPDLDPPSLAALREVAGRHAKDVLVVPRTSLATPVAATAWHARVLCATPEPATVERFVTTFVNQGPEKFPH